MGNVPDYKFNRKGCTHDHSNDLDARRLAELPESQGGPGRHRCASCAYAMGVRDGIAAERRRTTSKEVTKEDVDRALEPFNSLVRRFLSHQGNTH